MYLYITAVQNDDCEAGAAAWARPCLMDLGNNRPLLGAANVCPRALGLLDEEALTAVLTHEMIHALVGQGYELQRRIGAGGKSARWGRWEWRCGSARRGAQVGAAGGRGTSCMRDKGLSPRKSHSTISHSCYLLL